MKNLKDYLNEGLINRKVSVKTPIRYKPVTKEELKARIVYLIESEITNLNCIDVTEITDMSRLFSLVAADLSKGRDTLMLDMSEWDMSNVTDTSYMFAYCSNFTADLSNWDLTNVKNARAMFLKCYKFNSDISNWNMPNLENSQWMFTECHELDADITKWKLSDKLSDMRDTFKFCEKIKGDAKNWNLPKCKTSFFKMFEGCPNIIPPKWYVYPYYSRP